MTIYHMCKTFAQLPKPGGVLDQPSKLMFLFEHISAAESERDLLEQKKAERARQHAGKR
jgi:hypothetical protein